MHPHRHRTPARGFIRLLGLFLCSALVHASAATASASRTSLDGDHFRVFYAADPAFARAVLRRAEGEYSRINRELGFDRMVKAEDHTLWLWDGRCEIHLFPDRVTYLQETGAPTWAGGHVDYRARVMWSYAGSETFLDAVLPHELAHILFREFVGHDNKQVPPWLDEGVAQYAERAKRAESLEQMPGRVTRGEFFRFGQLNRMATRSLSGPHAANFYAQAVSIVHFLIESQGSRRFAEFLANLRDGYPIDRALSFATASRIDSLDRLEAAWHRFYADP